MFSSTAGTVYKLMPSARASRCPAVYLGMVIHCRVPYSSAADYMEYEYVIMRAV